MMPGYSIGPISMSVLILFPGIAFYIRYWNMNESYETHMYSFYYMYNPRGLRAHGSFRIDTVNLIGSQSSLSSHFTATFEIHIQLTTFSLFNV